MSQGSHNISNLALCSLFFKKSMINTSRKRIKTFNSTEDKKKVNFISMFCWFLVQSNMFT